MASAIALAVPENNRPAALKTSLAAYCDTAACFLVLFQPLAKSYVDR